MSASPLKWGEKEVLVSLYDRTGLAGEQYRNLGLRIEGLKEALNGELNVLAVTSPLMGEGKTSTAANLAIALATGEGRRVVLLDGDLRNPNVWSLFEKPPAKGFLDLLLGRANVSEAIVPTEHGGLDVLALPRASERRIEVLPVDRVRSVFKKLKQEYDFIVVDSPPYLPVADTAALVRMADGVVLVVRAGQTPRAAVQRVLDLIDRQKLIGFVLNAVVGRAVDPYYYPYHGNGRSGPEARNGSKA